MCSFNAQGPPLPRPLPCPGPLWTDAPGRSKAPGGGRPSLGQQWMGRERDAAHVENALAVVWARDVGPSTAAAAEGVGERGSLLELPKARSDHWGGRVKRRQGNRDRRGPQGRNYCSSKARKYLLSGRQPRCPAVGVVRPGSGASAPRSDPAQRREGEHAHFPLGSLLACSLCPGPGPAFQAPVGGTLHTHSAKSIYFDYPPTLVKNGAKVYKQTDFWDCFNLIILNYLLSWP